MFGIIIGIILIALIVAIGMGLAKGQELRKMNEEVKNKMSKIMFSETFGTNTINVSPEQIAINEEFFNIKDIQLFKVDIKTKSSSSLSNVIAGGLLAGGVGAVVGSQIGVKEKIEMAYLTIIINDEVKKLNTVSFSVEKLHTFNSIAEYISKK